MADITMATNNKHPRNHSGTGSDSHVTGRHFFSQCWGGDEDCLQPLGNQLSPGFSYLELEGRGTTRKEANPPLLCTVDHRTDRALPPACHSWVPPLTPLFSTSCRDWRSENSPPQLPLLKSRFLG